MCESLIEMPQVGQSLKGLGSSLWIAKLLREALPLGLHEKPDEANFVDDHYSGSGWSNF